MSVPDAELQLDPALLDLDLSPIKKERIIKARKQALREKLRADLPVLGVKEIRRFRLPYHEALLAELVESNHESTAEFIKQLLEYQEKIRKRFGPGTVIWLRPQLINSKYQLDTLTKGLTKAENAHNSGDFATECDEMLRLAAQYAFGPDDWWWLGEQLLYQCVSMHYPGNFKRQEAIAYYIIGKYLVENGKKVESGKYYLELARDMSIGKSWNCRKILDAKQDTVFMESCSLLYQALIEEARNLISTDPLKAIEVSLVARKRAAEACNHDGEFEAMIVKGKCELKLKKSTEAIATIMKVLNRAVRKKNIKALCEAKISLALAYLQYDNAKECLECLNELMKLGKEHNLPFYVAQSYRFMGEYYLKLKQPYDATPLLMLAFYIFHETNDMVRREKVRTWAAISAGDELFAAYIKLIEKCDGKDTPESHENLTKLIKWLDEREFFWTQQSKFTFSYQSLQKDNSHSKQESLDLIPI